MSATSTVVTAELFRYVAELTSGEDEFLRDLKSAAAAAGLPQIWIAPEQASLLQILLKLAGARRVVEVGTLAGYSAIAMARALPPGGTVRTIEICQEYADFARRWVQRSDVSDRVQVLCGPGRDVLANFEADSADAAFIDADKPNYAAYLQECLRVVRSGGLIAADNAFAFGEIMNRDCADPDVARIREFNDRMAAEKRLHSVIVPLGDGCWVGVKL